MRLTLRTLLSYLDDTLDPAETKIIGAKVADSEQARDLAERIKQVTRRRRLTTPPATGPGGIDANTIAEYLDNDVTPETAAEVEQICLASDVHLAEVAACHQILTLVLGEPAVVPPSAKQRMYGLVKGPEAIPSRRAARSAKNDNDLSSEIEPDHDDTLRLGVPALADGKDHRNLLLIGGGGVLAACCLGFAIYMLVGRGGGNVVEPKKDGGEQVAENNDGKKQDQAGSKDDEKKKTPEAKDKNDSSPPPVKEKDDPPSEIKAKPVDPKPDGPKAVEVVYAPASTKQVAVGQHVPPGIKEPAALLQLKSDKGGWTNLAEKDVFSGRPLLSLPGSKNIIALNSGVELTLWGNLVEALTESRAVLHANDLLDADVTLQRGRIVLRNDKKGATDALVRVRINNPTLAEEDYFDLVLHKGAAVVLERFSVMDREPFYDDPKDPPQRVGPTAKMRVYAYGGLANIRSGPGVVRAGQRSSSRCCSGSSRRGAAGSCQRPIRCRPHLPTTPPPPERQSRSASARQDSSGPTLELVALFRPKKSMSPWRRLLKACRRPLPATSWPASRFLPMRTFAGCTPSAATLPSTTWNSSFANSPPIPHRFPPRTLYMLTLEHWLAQGRDNDYVVAGRGAKELPKQDDVAQHHALFHLVSAADAGKPETYEHLIEGLNNDLMPIRVLSHSHLVGLVPQGSKRFSSIQPPRLRNHVRRRCTEWMMLIPPGRLPPSVMQQSMKKDKEKEKGKG